MDILSYGYKELKMKAYGVKYQDGTAWCGCCGGKYMKYTSNRNFHNKKNGMRAAKKAARQHGKTEVMEQI